MTYVTCISANVVSPVNKESKVRNIIKHMAEVTRVTYYVFRKSPLARGVRKQG